MDEQSMITAMQAQILNWAVHYLYGGMGVDDFGPTREEVYECMDVYVKWYARMVFFNQDAADGVKLNYDDLEDFDVAWRVVSALQIVHAWFYAHDDEAREIFNHLDEMPRGALRLAHEGFVYDTALFALADKITFMLNFKPADS